MEVELCDPRFRQKIGGRPVDAVGRKYEEGLASVIDLQTSSNQLLVAKAAKLNALLQYLIKKRVVDYYKGTPYLEQDY